MPIKFWHMKLDVMKDEFGESTNKGVLFHGLSNKTDAERYHAFGEAAKKWDESSPSATYHTEIGNLCEKLWHQHDQKAIQFFIESDIDQFKQRTVKARHKLAVPASAEWFSESHHMLIALDEERGQSLRASLNSRRLDQRLYYMNVDSADVWHDLINTGAYKIYDWCRESLRAMVNSKEWKEALASHEIGTFVALGGGGSASKDIEILNSLVEESYRNNYQEKTNYILLDISSHMLASSISRIKRYFRREPRAHKLLTIQAFAADMFRLSELKSRLRNGKSRNVWILTGATFGNFNEGKFITELEKVSSVGDLFVVGVDTYNPITIREDIIKIKQKYNTEFMLDYLATPISILLNHLDPDMRIRDLPKRIKTKVVDGRKASYSDIDRALTAEVRLVLRSDANSDDKEGDEEEDRDACTLLTSTRYESQALIEWLAGRGWKRLGESVPPEKGATYRQMLFEKVNEK